ncbi:MAG: ATP-dependent DNA helicase [Phycisphaerales bacterium]
MSLTPDDILGPSGGLSRSLGDAHEPRDQQLRMARAVASAMDDARTLVVEAGTGVGKSFAYLAPAIERIVRFGERVVVATNTIALQEQLITKDIPVLQRVAEEAGHTFKAVLVKGRGNYVSIRRLKLASERQDKLFADAASRRSLHVIEDWAYTTTDGTLSTLPALERPAVWDRAQSDSGNCMGRKCPTYEQCFFQNARREMESADLLICNHALYFSDLALRQRAVGFLPVHDHVILDEAHNVEDVASEHFGISLNEGRIFRLLGQLHHTRTGKGFLPQLQLQDGVDLRNIEHAIAGVADCDAATRALFDNALRLVGGEINANMRLQEPGMLDADAADSFRALSLRLKSLKDDAAREDDRFELNSYAERAEAIVVEVETLLQQDLPGCVYWIETAQPATASSVRVTIACAPVEVGPILGETLFNGKRSVTLTSATLAAGGDFSHALRRLGLTEHPDVKTLALGSPFEYAKQVRFIVDDSMPDPRAPNYVDALARAIVEHASSTRGGAFVLFTANSTMRAVARLARGPLESSGMPLVVQDTDGSRAAVLQRFRDEPNCVLFGVSSFWQGVDVRGDALRNVIITRLPFEPPDRPLTQARLDLLRQRGGDPFFDDSLPRAVIRFKQGFGRLVRSKSDTGRVVVLDPRIATKGYGRAFLAALPEGVTPERAERFHDEIPFDT